MGTVLVIVLVLLLLAAFPAWRYNRNWGVAPAGVVLLALMIVLLLIGLGHVPWWF